MSNFIATDNGWLNLDHVESFERVKGAKGRPSCIFRRPGGEMIDRKTGYGFEPEDIEGVIIPAAANARGVVVAVYTSSDRPTEKDVSVDHYPIVAWRIDRDIATPILPTQISSEAVTLIELPDGRYDDFLTGSYDTLDAAKAYALLTAQDAWDWKHPVAEDAS